MSKAASESVDSLLLSPKENKLVVQTLGKGKKSLATAVAQIYLALPSDRTRWTKLGAGVVCLVKDKQEKSFFIRFLDIKEKCIVWEQELYKQFKYRAVSKSFQTFFAHDCRAGINFANTEEAALFRAAIMERVNVFKRKRDEMRQRKMAAYQQQQQLNFQMNAMQAMQNPYFRMRFMPPQVQSMMMMQMRAPALAANQRAQLQAMINSMSPEAKQAFVMRLKSGGSMGSVYGQPSTMSGMFGGPAGRYQSNFTIPPSASQVPYHHQRASKAPQNVARSHRSKPSHETHSTFHSPPPESVPAEAPSFPIETGPSETPTMEATPAPPPPPAGAPAPPPPPPPPSFVPPPPAPSSATGSGASASAKSPSGSADRGGLLQSIQAGTKLRKVGESTSSRKEIPKVQSNSMRGALARALDNRAKVLGDDDSDDDDEWDDDDDDDWSD